MVLLLFADGLRLMPFRVAFYKLIGSILVRVLIDLVRSSLAATRFCQNWRIPGACIGLDRQSGVTCCE